MQIPARVHYGCLAMLELAVRADDDRPVALREIAVRHGIPQPFLVQILQQLKSIGWVTSTRGSQGGYRLTIDPQQLTLLDIAESIGSGEAGCSAADDRTAAGVELRGAWDAAAEAYREILAQTRLSDLAERCAESGQAMFYI